MTVVTVDSSFQNVLNSLTEKAELRDQQGQVIGFFTPQKIAEDELYEWAIAEFKKRGIPKEPPPDNSTGYNLEQLMAHLQTLEKK